jgi:hypothetical protein
MLGGLEPPISCVTGRRFNQLSYSTMEQDRDLVRLGLPALPYISPNHSAGATGLTYSLIKTDAYRSYSTGKVPPSPPLSARGAAWLFYGCGRNRTYDLSCIRRML